MFSTSWIICFDSGLKGLNDQFCRRSCCRACRSGWFSIFWINSRTLVFCACFTTECGNPGIRKSMFASFTIIDSWLTSSSATDFSVLLRSISSPTLNVSLSIEQNGVWELSDTLITSCVITGRPVRSCACSKLKSFLSSDERVWDYTRLMNGFSRKGSRNRSPRSLWRTRSFAKRINIDLLRTRRFFFHLAHQSRHAWYQVAPISHELDLGIGWFDWKFLDSCPASGRWACSEPNSLFHSCFKEIFGGGRGDMYTFSYKTSPVFILPTFGMQYAGSVSCLFHALCMYCAWRGTL